MGLTRLRAEQISDIDYKQAVRVILLTNITLSGGAPNQVDGVNLTVNDRILVNGQDTGSQNGIYQVQTVGTGSNGTWIRSLDTNQTGELEAGTIVMVTEGNTYKDTQWKLTTNNPIVIGTTALTFEQNSAYAFGNVYANGTAVLATSVGDSLTLAPGNNIEITGNNTTKTVTVAVTGISLNSISNGTSNVNVVSSGGNVTVGIGGTNNVVVFASGTTTFATNVLPSANVTYSLGSNTARWKDLWLANNSIYLGDVILGATATTLTVNGANVLTGNAGSNFSTTGNIIGGNILTSGVVTATGNVTGGNILTDGLISASGTFTAANITGSNLLTTGLITSTGNVTGGNITTTGVVTATSNITGGNILTAGIMSSTGNVTGGNILTSGLISTTGNLFANNGLINGNLTVNGNVTYINSNVVTINDLAINLANNAATAAAADGGGIEIGPQGSPYITWLYNNSANTFTSSAGISAVGNISGANLRTAGVITATGNVTGGNILTGGLISATSTITSASNIQGGNLLTGGLISATANIQGGNLLTVGLISATSSITSASNIVGGNITTAGLITATGNVTGGNILTTGLISATSTITSAANIIGSNLLTGGLVSATGNVTGNFFNGNGSALTGINAFSNIAVTGGNSVIADSISDTLTITAGDGIAIVADAATDTITISASGGSEIFVDGADFGLVTEPVTESDDLGLVTESVTAENDLGTLVTSGLIYPDQFVLPTYTVAQVANVSATPAGQMVYVSNESGGAVPAFSDGSNWRRVTDRQIVS